MAFFSKIFRNKKTTIEEPPTTVEIPSTCAPITCRTSLKDAFVMKYPLYTNILTMFEAANLCEATWENLTKVRLQCFIDYMGERLSPNSVNQYATKLKAVLNLYADEVELPRDYAKVLTPKKCISTAVFLTENELQKLIDYIPKNKKELYVRNLFIICSYVGCRHSDGMRLHRGLVAAGSGLRPEPFTAHVTSSCHMPMSGLHPSVKRPLSRDVRGFCTRPRP